MLTVHVIGVGALGSHFSDEIARWCHAKNFSLRLNLYDFDKVESRNCASQIFIPGQVGMNKAEAVEKHLASYTNITVNAYPGKVECASDIQGRGPEIIVDALDNVESRRNVWTIGKARNSPILHGGLSVDETGLVTWTTDTFDNFPLSPASMDDKTALAENESVVSLPPCELVEMRGVINNTARCMVLALWSAFGLFERLPALVSYTTTNTSVQVLYNLPLDGPIVRIGGENNEI